MSKKVRIKDRELQMLRARFTTADDERMRWTSIWDRAYKFAIPHLSMRNGATPNDNLRESAGEDLNTHIYDTTLARATNVFASKFFNGLTPIAQKWVRFEVGDELKKTVVNTQPVQIELDRINEIIFQFINASNFYEEMGNAYENFAIGTMALLVKFNPHNRTRPFLFESVNPQTLALELSPNNKPENVWRTLHVKAADIKVIWPTAKLTPELKETAKEAPTALIKLIEGTLFQPDKNNFLHIVLGPMTSDILLAEENESSPWIITRFSARPNEAFGRGRALMAMHSAITLNKMVLFMLQQAQIQMAPPFKISFDSMINPHTVRIGPNKLIPVENPKDFEKIDVGGDFEIGKFEIESLQTQIEAIMLTNPMGLLNAPAKTATEVSGRINEAIEELAPTVGRYIAEFYHPLFERLLFITKTEGLTEFSDPVRGITLKNNQIKLIYTAPLIRRQEAQDFQSIDQFIQFFQRMLGPELAPEVMHEALLPQYIAGLLHIPERFVKSENEINLDLQRALQAQQQQQQQANPTPQQQASSSVQNAFSDAQDIGPAQTPTGI